MDYQSRAYAGEADYQAIRTLLVESFALSGHPAYCTVGELDWWRCLEGPSSIGSARLWTRPSGHAAGLAWPDGDQVELLVRPDDKCIEDDMLAWSENRLHEMMSEDEVCELKVQAFECDLERIQTLGDRGYCRGELRYVFRSRSLSEPIGDAPLHGDYRIRHLAGEHEAGCRVAVHRSAFHPSRMTEAKHLRAMHSPTYRRDLDLVVEHKSGDFAAFCIVWFDEANKLGVFEPVGCHSDHRRRGLARAVMTEGLRRLVTLGARQAIVGSLCANPASNGLYETLGFGDPRRTHEWTKPRPTLL